MDNIINMEEVIVMACPFGLVELAGKIDPEVFVAHLESAGWKLFPRKDPRIKIFQQEKDVRLFQATIPMSRILGDYGEAMYRAAESVAACEGNQFAGSCSIWHRSPEGKYCNKGVASFCCCARCRRSFP